jgi:hypothetical protein
MRRQYHSDHSIHLVSRHPYVSPFMWRLIKEAYYLARVDLFPDKLLRRIAFRTAVVLRNETAINQRIAARIHTGSSAALTFILPIAIGLVSTANPSSHKAQ